MYRGPLIGAVLVEWRPDAAESMSLVRGLGLPVVLFARDHATSGRQTLTNVHWNYGIDRIPGLITAHTAPDGSFRPCVVCKRPDTL